MKTMEKLEIRKELYKSKAEAIFSHYVSGNLYYTIEVNGGIYQFPIPTVEAFEFDQNSHLDAIGATYDPGDSIPNGYHLSSDLGTTSFYKEMKGSELNRWIGKAIDNKEFIKL